VIGFCPMVKLHTAVEVADDIERRIQAGDFPAGEALPTYTQLAADYHVSRTTIATTILLLKERGLVEGRPGRAVFVREDI
jgi:DNA-binding GntR family transcriptional regulator